MQHLLRPGELIIGEFEGDADMLLLECDSRNPDSGSVIVGSMDEFIHVASSIDTFVRKYIATPGRKYWEDDPKSYLWELR